MRGFPVEDLISDDERESLVDSPSIANTKDLEEAFKSPSNQPHEPHLPARPDTPDGPEGSDLEIEVSELGDGQLKVAEGMKTEVQQLERLKVGRCLVEKAGREMAKQKKVFVLTSRWVLTQKTAEIARCSLVVRDFATGAAIRVSEPEGRKLVGGSASHLGKTEISMTVRAYFQWAVGVWSNAFGAWESFWKQLRQSTIELIEDHLADKRLLDRACFEMAVSIRLVHELLGPDMPVELLLFADDLEALGANSGGRRGITLAFLYMSALGFPYKWSKQRGGLRVEWVGLFTDYSLYKLGMSPKRAKWLHDWVLDLAMKGEMQSPPPLKPEGGEQLLFYTDAKATDETAWIGGFKQGADGRIISWFSEEITVSWAVGHHG
eukprot:s3758_g1.t1